MTGGHDDERAVARKTRLQTGEDRQGTIMNYSTAERLLAALQMTVQRHIEENPGGNSPSEVRCQDTHVHSEVVSELANHPATERLLPGKNFGDR